MPDATAREFEFVHGTAKSVHGDGVAASGVAGARQGGSADLARPVNVAPPKLVGSEFGRLAGR